MNREHFYLLFHRVWTSLWFIPSAITTFAAALAFGTVAIDSRIPAGQMSPYIFGAGAEGARGVLTTIAGSLITVTGVVFSITIVALQLASSQFTPRLLRSFTADRANQIVLGVFIGTFTYSLLVLRTVRSADDDRVEFIPEISVTVALVLALTSIAALIFFIDHVANLIRVETVLERLAKDIRSRMDAVYSRKRDESTHPSEAPEGGWSTPDGPPFLVQAEKEGYLQSLDEEALLELATDCDLVIDIDVPIGEFIVTGDILARAWPFDAGSDARDAIRNLFEVGVERTLEQDVERGLIELTDIAVRALSPGINDPATALACIDRLTQVLSYLGTRRRPSGIRADPDGRLRIRAARPSFDRLTRFPFARIRHYGGSQPAVAYGLARSLGRVGHAIGDERREVIVEELRELRDAAMRTIASDGDRRRLHEEIDRALAEIGEHGPETSDSQH